MDYEKKIGKIRKLLGDRFHLGVGIDIDGIKSWVLYKKYKDSKIYFSKDNTMIMSSETNTLDELMEFAKKHHKIDEHFVISKLITYMLWFAFVICVLNAFLWDSNYVRVGVIVTDIIAIIIDVSMYFVWDKNWKVDMYELDENYKQRLKEIKEDLDGLGNKKSNKRRISKRVGKSSNSRRDS